MRVRHDSDPISPGDSERIKLGIAPMDVSADTTAFQSNSKRTQVPGIEADDEKEADKGVTSLGASAPPKKESTH